MVLRLNPSSLSHADMTEPINTQGNPLAIPNPNTVANRLSEKSILK